MKYKLKISIPILMVVIMIAITSFSPGLLSNSKAEAAECRPGWYYEPEYLVGLPWATCLWDVGCFINPLEPDGEWQYCERLCRDKIDDIGYCGTDCNDVCSELGVCCNY